MQVSGNLTMALVGALLQEGLKTQVDDNLEIDLSGIEKVDSSGVSLMLAWQREAQRGKINLRFSHVPQNLVSLAQLYGVAELLSLSASK